MLIGIDASRALRSLRTGTERYSLEIIRHMLRLEQAQHHSWRLYTDAPASDDAFLIGEIEQPPAIEMRTLPARRIWTHRALANEVLRHRPDILYIPAHVLPFVLPARRLPLSVVSVHDLGHRRFPAAYSRMQWLYLELSTRWAVRAAVRLIAVSHATGRDLENFYHAPAAQIQVVHEATLPFSPPTAGEAAAVQALLGIKRPFALYIGTLQPRKNLARLIDSYARLHEKSPVSFDLVLAGRAGRYSDELRGRVRLSGLENRIHFTGYIPEEHLASLLHTALMFCYPSLFEGFGLPILEAHHAGVPVLTANNSSLPEVAGSAALFVDPTDIDAIADAMLRLSQDNELRQRLIAAGYENVKRFSWQKAAQETLNVLESAAQRR
jgi:glycosyltransferase involved in cell wall biosynthesis